MNENERFYARKEFLLKFLQLKGIEFENFFAKIMGYGHKEFETVKPWGNLGDRKNDGFIKSKGIYYQVFAPEKPSIKISKAISKLREDFTGLYEFWQNKYPIREFYFVFNGESTNPRLEMELSSLRKEYPTIKFNLLLRNQLESIFIGLSKSKIQILIGGIPSPDELLKDIDYSLLPGVIKHILSLNFNDSEIKIRKIAPNYDKKIRFNNLEKSKHYLNNAYFQLSKIKEYFLDNPDKKECLKIKFVKLYNKSRNLYPCDEELQFHYILNVSSPNKKVYIKNAVIILLALYFEACDIFEAPE